MLEREIMETQTNGHSVESTNIEKTSWWVIIVFIVIVLFFIGLWIYWPVIASSWAIPNVDNKSAITYSDMGCFGDSFGGLNVLVAAFAFIGFLFALYLQRIDLQLQRDEMKLTRKEMKDNRLENERQTHIYEEQNALITNQLQQAEFQRTFQAYWNIYNSLTPKYDKYNYMHDGNDFLKYISKILKYYTNKYTGLNFETKDMRSCAIRFYESYSELKSIYIQTSVIIEIIQNTSYQNETSATYMQKIICSLSGRGVRQALGAFLCLCDIEEFVNEDCIKNIRQNIKPTSSAALRKMWLAKIQKLLADTQPNNPEDIGNSASKILDKFVQDAKKGRIITQLTRGDK